MYHVFSFESFGTNAHHCSLSKEFEDHVIDLGFIEWPSIVQKRHELHASSWRYTKSLNWL